MKKTGINLVQIIKILSDGKYHDGSTVGTKLGITRSAVWKLLKKLEVYGVEIDSVKGRGYRLRQPLQLFDKEYILTNSKNHKFKLDIYENIDSTNEYLRKLQPEKFPRICLTEQQTKGRGRLGRSWHSPFAQNIYLSCSYLFQIDITGLAGLSLVVGLAAINAIVRYLSVEPLKIKWPNDIVYDGKKLAGILIDIQAEANGLSRAIIGIGLNVNMLADKAHQIPQGWTSIAKIIGNQIDRNEIAVKLIGSILLYLEKFTATGLTGFLEEWRQVDYLFDHDITIKAAEEKAIGKAQGIDQYGRLLVELLGGAIRAFSGGDTTVSAKTL